MARTSPIRLNASSFTPARFGMLQRKCACGGNPSGSGECEECKKKQSTLQRAPTSQTAASTVPPIVHEVLRSPSQPLDAATRAAMEPRFGHDFSRIRVHTDAHAADSARAVNALAYTVGHDVVFGRGQYRPGSDDGQQLIAHELTHTLQQKAGTSLQESGPSESTLEAEAEMVSQDVVNGRAFSVSSSTPLRLSRQPAPAKDPNPAEDASRAPAAATEPDTIDGFVTGSAEISPVNLAKLGVIATRIQASLKDHPDSKVLVVGHTDAQGNERDNVALGVRRAVAARDALAKMGVPAKVMQTESKGQTEPVDDSGKKDDPRNRRVEVHLESPGPTPEPPLKPAPDLPPSPCGPGTSDPFCLQPKPVPRLKTSPCGPGTSDPFCLQPPSPAPSPARSYAQIARDGVVKALKLINPSQDEDSNIVPYDGNNAQVKDPSKVDISGWSKGFSLHGKAFQKDVPGYDGLQVKIYFDDKERNNLTTIGLEHSGAGHVADYILNYSPILHNPSNHTNADIAADFCADVEGGCP